MKKYYTKYLPIEGEIKVGEICLITDEDGLIGFLPFKQIYVDEGGILPKKVELFLCSRDIKIGDHAMELLTTGDYDTFQIDTENDIYDDMIADGRQFKVIGKVSKKATWVKDGDEFDENEIQLLYHETYSYGGPASMYWDTRIIECKIDDKKMKVDKDNFYYPIEIKGPCGHFH